MKDPKVSSPRIKKKEGLDLLKNADLLGLGMMADNVRKRLHPGGTVSFIIDRNINYTNVCINQCRFCAFYRDEKDPDAYVLTKRKLFNKIRETIKQGGTQILMQGGLHPDLSLDYYVDLLESIKEKFRIHIHGFSPPEITYIADKSGFTIKKTLIILREAGLDSIPGGGAEILSDRVRERVSPKKIGAKQWLKVMEEAHHIGMRTTATMMFGSVEEPEDIIEHLDAVRKLQDKTGGFTAFIPWSFQPGNTELIKKAPPSPPFTKRGFTSSKLKTQDSKLHPATAVEYLRVLALSRIYLDNVPNIQASWVTQGLKMAQVALRFGANDFGSAMIEENVVAAAGVKFRVSVQDIINAIRGAGFKPAQRDMYYNILMQV
ncbi:MAG TPA: dehypoxanthine futalosine cyclase [Nitrospirae bacterium]|nr:dehypoxanthine futalosine cyclase [Nitrospirota bacterium]HDZ01856.1 dehypoxanthine futalosine cyclase [Nitrospirota bacterium]